MSEAEAEVVAIPTVEYIASENLPDLNSPQECIKTLGSRLDSKDWLLVCEALTNARQLSLFHSSSLEPELRNVVNAILKSLKNPRSALVKTSLMTSADLFRAFKDKLLSNLDALLLQLLLKASEDKRFVAEEGERALLALTSSLSPVPLLEKLKPYSVHKSPKVRAKAAVSISNCVSQLDSAGIQGIGFNVLIRLAGGLVCDHLPESRDAAKKMTLLVHKAFEETQAQVGTPPETRKDKWQNLCRSQLSVTNAMAILKLCK